MDSGVGRSPGQHREGGCAPHVCFPGLLSHAPLATWTVSPSNNSTLGHCYHLWCLEVQKGPPEGQGGPEGMWRVAEGERRWRNVAPSIQLVAWGRVGAWKNHLPQPGEGACSQDHVTWRPRLHPGRKRGLGVSSASHTFHNKPTHGKNPATRPSNHGKHTRTNQHHGNAEGTGQREGVAAPSWQRVQRLCPCVHSWRAWGGVTPHSSHRAAPASGPHQHRGKEPPLLPQPAWLGGTT